MLPGILSPSRTAQKYLFLVKVICRNGAHQISHLEGASEKGFWAGFANTADWSSSYHPKISCFLNYGSRVAANQTGTLGRPALTAMRGKRARRTRISPRCGKTLIPTFQSLSKSSRMSPEVNEQSSKKRPRDNIAGPFHFNEFLFPAFLAAFSKRREQQGVDVLPQLSDPGDQSRIGQRGHLLPEY
jgi:hypothetical protein